MKASQTLQNGEPTSTENAFRRAVDTTPAFIHTAGPMGTWIILIGDGWIFLVKLLEEVGRTRFTAASYRIESLTVAWSACPTVAKCGRLEPAQNRS